MCLLKAIAQDASYSLLQPPLPQPDERISLPRPCYLPTCFPLIPHLLTCACAINRRISLGDPTYPLSSAFPIIRSVHKGEVFRALFPPPLLASCSIASFIVSIRYRPYSLLFSCAQLSAKSPTILCFVFTVHALPAGFGNLPIYVLLS
ncbi:hypothetical protein F5878DRAFT_277514 [Lentinula raphanica]|uniref:Uncharacterized protein n=1 Tax=Lentinula raphanica TaxID=153919 RepID=A0AA38UBK6_9AGAR|nr:hypothetical protein F5878DRAFT_277514 [Lentinula raphanica]